MVWLRMVFCAGQRGKGWLIAVRIVLASGGVANAVDALKRCSFSSHWNDSNYKSPAAQLLI